MRLSIIFIISFISFQLHAQSIENYVVHNIKDNTCGCELERADFSASILTDAIKNGIENPYFLGCTYHCLGIYHYYYNNEAYAQAITAYKAAIEIREKHKDPFTSKSYRNLGYAYIEADYPAKGIKAALQAMDLNEEYRQNATANIYLSRGYREIGEYEHALKYAHIALDISEPKADKGYAHDNLSIIWSY